MYYVKTARKQLANEVYNPETVFAANRDRGFYLTFPAPIRFNVNMGTMLDFGYMLDSSAVQLLATWYCRGTQLSINNYNLPMCPHPRSEWTYEFVNDLPQTYINRGICRPAEALAFGRRLIEACTKTSRIPFEHLEQAYKVIIKFTIQHGVYATSPNAKTYLEAKAELEANKEFEGMIGSTPHIDTPYTTEELEFYAKVFDIELPHAYITASHVRTKHGFATCPYICNSVEYKPYRYDTTEKAYDPTKAPYTMTKDALPIEIINQELYRNRLAEQVTYFLGLPIEEQRTFMTKYDYCELCHEYYLINTGCYCGANLPLEEIELSELKDAYTDYAATH